MKKVLIVMMLVLMLYGCNINNPDKRLDIPNNLRREQHVIFFDEVDHATSYVLEINGENIIITNTTYTLETKGDFNIRVKAKAEGYLDSFYTERLLFTIPLELRNVRFNYSLSSDFNLKVYQFETNVSIDSIKLNEISIPQTNYHLFDNALYISKEYLKNLNTGLHELIISLGSLGSFSVTLNIMNTNLPYIVTHNTITHEISKNHVFQFELFGGNFLGLSNNDITHEDYIFSDNTLTIYSTYINSYFLSNPTAQTLSIKYDLQKDDRYVFGYIFINKT